MDQKYLAFFLSFGIISGVAVGFGYLPALYIAWTYFPNKKSLVTGLILFWAGLSTLILAPLTTAIVNPDNVPEEDYKTLVGNVPKMWYYVSGLYTLIFVISAALQPQPWDAEEENAKLRAKRAKELAAKENSPKGQDSNSGNPHQNIINNKLGADKKKQKKARKTHFADDEVEERMEEPKKNYISTIKEERDEGSPRNSVRNVAIPGLISTLGRNSLQQRGSAFTQNEVLQYDTQECVDRNSGESPTRWNRGDEDNSFQVLLGDEAGFKMNHSGELDQIALEMIEAVEKKMIQADMNNVLSEADIHMIGGVGSKRLASLSASFQVRSQNQFSTRLSKQYSGTGYSKSDTMSKLVTQDMYKLSHAIISAECPSIYHGLTSWHYWLLVSTVTTSLAFDYFINSVWKSYGTFAVGVDDSVITNAMVVASLCNAFVRVFVGQLLSTISYKKFYLCLLFFKIISAFTLVYATASIWTYTLNVSYAYICIGSQSTLFPTFAIKIFGSKVGAKLFPMIYFFFAMANVLQWALTYFIFSDMKNDYQTLIYILGGLVVCSFILTMFIQEDPDWYKAVKQYNEALKPNKELSMENKSDELLKVAGKKA